MLSQDERKGAAQRTEEERERARAEREQRRLATAKPTSPPVEARPDAQDGSHVETKSPVSHNSGPPHRSLPHRPHLSHRPHLHRPHLPRRSDRHTRPARFAMLIGLGGVLAVLAAGAVLLARSGHPKAPVGPQLATVVVPEGETAAQIARIASSDGLKGDYLAAVRAAAAQAASGRSPGLHPSSYGAPSQTHSLEGFLFPATYELYAGAPVSRFVSEQLEAFNENFGGAEIARAKALGETPYQLLTIASMIEREAAIPRDRPLVAAVIYNRLRLHMALGIDATIRYALHDYSRPLTEAQLRSSSPYNTRTHRGLPPTPISNPGMASIRAAAGPAKVSYLYYVAGADGCGELVFSRGYSQFEANAAAYRAALARNGGNAPTCKRRK
jgi:cell division protein YceG involved in septum cleavage